MRHRRSTAFSGVAQVGRLHLVVGAHGLRRVAGDHAAVDHHRDAVGDAEHRVHVVLDQQDRVAGLQLAAAVRQHALGLLGAHAGQRLVEQQHLGLGGQAHGDLELAPLAVRQRAGGGRAGRPARRAIARIAACRLSRAARGRRPTRPRAAGGAPAPPGGSSPAP
jgi:hypothetical protein